MNKRFWIVGFAVLVLVFGSGFLLGKSNFIGIPYTSSYLAGQPEDADFTLFWEAWSALDKKYPFEKPATQEKIYGAIKGLAASYGDPYTMFFDPKEAKTFDEDISGTFGGVGIELGLKNGFLTVVAPLKDTPADKAHIIAGDIVSSIEGKSTAGLSVEEAIQKIRGNIGTAITLGIFSKDSDKERQVKLVRENIHVPILETKKEGDVFVVSLYSFSEDSAKLFANAMAKFKESGTNKMIIDLRDNPGGYLDAAVDIASWFLPQGKVIVSEDLGEGTEKVVHRSRGYNLGVNNPNVIILVNQGSASASEIVAGALSEQVGFKLVGEHTYGKGSVQEVLPLSHDTTIKITVARWLTPDGKSLNEHSLDPDVAVELTADDIKKEKDPQLAKALQLLQ